MGGDDQAVIAGSIYINKADIAAASLGSELRGKIEAFQSMVGPCICRILTLVPLENLIVTGGLVEHRHRVFFALEDVAIYEMLY